jgi:hypothetical protein
MKGRRKGSIPGLGLAAAAMVRVVPLTGLVVAC